ncbi:MAG: ROK family protein [Terricaulis silvestris]
MTGLTTATVGGITNQFLNEGLIFKSGRRSGERGQPASHLSINPDGGFSLGLNIDRDHLTLLAMDFSGNIRARVSREIEFASPADTSTFLKGAIQEIVKSKVFPMRRLAGFGVAMPDALGETQLPGQPAAYKAWSTLDVEGFVGKLISTPVFRENDAAAAAMGELYFGKGLHSNSFYYILISAGLGGGLVINRRYYRGAHGRSGEIGFMPAGESSKKGPLATLGDEVLMQDLFEMLRTAGVRVSSPGQLAKLEAPARKPVQIWAAQVAERLYQPILTLICGIDPDAVFIGGRLPALAVDAICDELNKRLSISSNLTWPHAVVKRAALAEDAAAMGAAILPFMDSFLPNDSALA